MLLRDRLLARLDDMGGVPDYQRLASEVLGIRNASADLARRLITQALVIEDRRDRWQRVGESICAAAPETPGVYVLRDASARVLYVGKAVNIRRRLRAHFAARRWSRLSATFARAVSAEWLEIGSELEALVREATLIAELQPVANVQIGAPRLTTRAIPPALVRDVIVVLPSIDTDAAELIAAKADGAWMIQRARRDGADLATRSTSLWRFFRASRGRRGPAALLAPIVFSWLARRGEKATRLDPHDASSARELRGRLSRLLSDDQLFTERIVVR